jgi:hypothetical protein
MTRGGSVLVCVCVVLASLVRAQAPATLIDRIQAENQPVAAAPVTAVD